ncbi:dihydrolipoamide acetyltransferase family protein [Actinomadura mexicana]|uniref:Dihydrolipoamide acetyltransferase component of pyruvate dehydrogenase complex n=1 Tax=Actinomadura mexicana TaxID=134959 RepID=A0A238XFU8_9ACTN|nr:dihydrolipoamide acetyltransferase family protein [Actinomadura mexicana]SNR57194.1 2-oxoglutarate dehydrogenase E2 component [Actinomadura mexicana]
MTTQSVETVLMPRLSDSMEEATIVEWLKAPGDRVSRGDDLVEIETDKATMVYEAEVDGVLEEVLVGAGGVAALGAPIARLAVPGTSAAEPDSAAPPRAVLPPTVPRPAVLPPTTPPTAPPPPSAALAAVAKPPTVAVPPAVGDRPHRVSATPAARRAATELGVELDTVPATGPFGRIVRADVTRVGSATKTAPPRRADAQQPARPAEEPIALSPTQKTIARRMSASRTEIPEFTLTAEIDMTSALELRRSLLALRPERPFSVNDLVVKAVAMTLREHPRLNASWGGDHVVRHGRVNIGVAVATDDALLVPTVSDVDTLAVAEIAMHTRAAAERARSRTATLSELAGATFTVTNLGMFGVLNFSAVINPPQVAILAVGTVVRRPMFASDGSVTARDLMQVSLSCDHRAVYGADGARFLDRLRTVLENPLELVVPPAQTDRDGLA